METDPVSETLCFLVSRILGDGQSRKPSKSEYYTPLLEPFRLYSICHKLISSLQPQPDRLPMAINNERALVAATLELYTSLQALLTSAYFIEWK
jgi:hypothetical protein